MRNFSFILAMILLPGCAQSILINYSYDQSKPVGKLIVIPDKPIEGTNFVMDGRLLVDNKYVKRITVENIPTGVYAINMTCASWYYKEPLNYLDSVQIEANKEVTKLVPTPTYSSGYYAYLIGSGIAPLLLVLLLF